LKRFTTMGERDDEKYNEREEEEFEERAYSEINIYAEEKRSFLFKQQKFRLEPYDIKT